MKTTLMVLTLFALAPMGRLSAEPPAVKAANAKFNFNPTKGPDKGLSPAGYRYWYRYRTWYRYRSYRYRYYYPRYYRYYYYSYWPCSMGQTPALPE